MTMNALAFICITYTFVKWINCMDPVKKGNENFPSRNLPEDTNFDSAYPSFNVHYNFEPKDWKSIEIMEKENTNFLNEINNEIKRMAEDKKKINYVLNIQKHQLEELLFFIIHIKHNKNNRRDRVDTEKENEEKDNEEDGEKQQVDTMPLYLRSGEFVEDKLDDNMAIKMFNEINDYTVKKFRLTEQDSFYHTLAEQWIS
ncbi:conserved Plasmodium protein, unknown function [Plasmodium ovale curtisi]|uniref:Uncharacterized protein n=3 Tax=Plasmodium ovale TaxID=36330 RepID=A0A1A8WAS6_PLAOA|nr:conserved Plasmodium protein, unknown function [Plasmodium ovale curtisi]